MNDKDQLITELIELNEELENYFRNTIIPQLFVDANLRLRKFTPPAMKQFNLSDGDVGKSIQDIKENLRFPTIIENIQAVIDTNEILEKEIQTTDFRWYQMNVIPYIIRTTNKVNGVIITFVEITRRIKDLKEQESLISDHETLLDSLSHDFKTPITSLTLTIEQLKKLPPDNLHKSQALLNIIDSGVRKMKKIIVDLTASRHDEHKYRDQTELLNIEHVLEDVTHTLADNILATGAVVKSNILISEINFSRRKLRSIIYNLVLNSIKYQSPDRKPEILISTGQEENLMTISVKDNGAGIPPDKLDAIFSKYFRVANAKEGTGIGLYLVREMVNNSGGRISVTSRLGVGSEFKVYLKLDPADV
jgi:two-component system phosphate regulon sensor histidine kinase PhoR